MSSDDPGNHSNEEMYDQYEPEESSSSVTTVVQQADEANKESQLDPAPNDYDNTSSIIIKKSSNNMEYKCQKCDKKVVNGIICSNCDRKYHWRCGGITNDDEKTKVMQSNNWECYICRSSDNGCLSCKDKVKEVRNLKEYKCQKCDKKVVNGVICSNCDRKYHWRCGGITKDDEKTKVMQSNNWECYICLSIVR